MYADARLPFFTKALAVLGIEADVRALGVPLAATYGDTTHTGSRHGLGAGQASRDPVYRHPSK